MIAKSIANYKQQYNIKTLPTMTNPVITDVSIDGDFIIAIVNDFFKYTINRDRLEKWLYENSLLDWLNDWNEGGEHKQASGTMTFDEWFDSNYVDEDVFSAIEAFDLKPEEL